MKKVFIIICLISLTGCSWYPPETLEEEIVAQEKQKDPFYISTKNFETLQKKPLLRKYGKVLGEDNIIVTSQASGRIKSISHKIGDNVKKGTKIITLKDSSGSYTFNKKRAETALTQAKLSYEQTKVSLDKVISDTDFAIQQASQQATEAKIQQENSTDKLQVQQLNQQIEKAEHDYQTKIDADETTIQNFINTVKNLQKDIQLFYEEIKTTTDKIVGTSELYKSENDAFERILGARNTNTRYAAETQVRLLFQKQTQINNLNKTIDKENLQDNLIELKDTLKSFEPVLDTVDTMLEYTITSKNLPPTQLGIFVNSIKVLKTKLQGQTSFITQQINNIESFLSVYKQQQKSLEKSVNLAKKQANISRENIKTAKNHLNTIEANTDIQLASMKASYRITKKTKKATLASLSNAIEQSRISLEQANNNLNKLSIESPLSGIIKEVFVDLGQEVSPGTPLFSMMSKKKLQIEITLNSEEIAQIKKNQKVSIITKENNIPVSGKIQTFSTIADKNFRYKTIIEIDTPIKLLGDLIEVQIPIKSKYPLIPLEYITILNTTQGIIYIFNKDDKTLQEKKVELGKVRETQIEIISKIPPKAAIITSSVNNFDKNKHELITKNRK